MTYEQIQAALAELTLAARTKQLRQASVMFMGFVPRPYEKAHCAVSRRLWTAEDVARTLGVAAE